MAPELSLEQMAEAIQKMSVTANSMDKFLAMNEDHKDKDMSAKKAMEEKHEEEKMEAKKAKYNAAIKSAMEEDDHDKKEAMVKSAMDELHDKHDANHEQAPIDEKKAMEEKEKDAQIASIINDKKQQIIAKILTANTFMNPTGLKEVEARLKSASILDVEKEWNILAPAFEGAVAQPVQDTQKFIPYYANITPTDVDSSTLSASSSDSEFSKLSTAELLGRSP